MSVEMDMSEVRSLGHHLKTAGTRLEPALDALLGVHAERAATTARAGAPRDRPWLGTTEGIQVVKRRKLTRTILSPKDQEGQSVGYRVEYGTSVMAPRPFVGPAVAREREPFNREALALLVKTTL